VCLGKVRREAERKDHCNLAFGTIKLFIRWPCTLAAGRVEEDAHAVLAGFDALQLAVERMVEVVEVFVGEAVALARARVPSPNVMPRRQPLYWPTVSGRLPWAPSKVLRRSLAPMSMLAQGFLESSSARGHRDRQCRRDGWV
jgi:hypothetical protein